MQGPVVVSTVDKRAGIAGLSFLPTILTWFENILLVHSKPLITLILDKSVSLKFCQLISGPDDS